MAFPLLIPVAIGLLGLYGAGKTIKAVCDSSSADDIASSAELRVRQAKANLDHTKEATNLALESYGKKKIEALEKPIQPFIELFQQLKNVEFVESTELYNLKIGEFSKVNVAELQHSFAVFHGMLQGLGAGAAGGALTAFGAYGGSMMLASAGTGTAISSLSGAAATNATLAWLGGGTLTAGGLGIAGGTMVLGTLVAGPALLIFGSVLGAKASEKLSEAYSNLEKASTFEVEVDGICKKMLMIQEVTNTASDVLSTLRARLRRSNDALAKTLKAKGTNFSEYDQEAKATVFQAVKYAQLIKNVIDTPILNAKGELKGESHESLLSIKASST